MQDKAKPEMKKSDEPPKSRKIKIHETYIPSQERQTVENFTCFYCERKFKSKGVVRYHVSTHKICHEKHEERKKNHPNAKTCKEDQDLRDNFSYKCQYCQMGQPSEAALSTHITSFNDINSVSIFHNTLWTMHTPSKLALSFVHTKIVQYGF